MRFKLHNLKEEFSTKEKIIISILQYFGLLYFWTIRGILTILFIPLFIIAAFYEFMFDGFRPFSEKIENLHYLLTNKYVQYLRRNK